MPGIEEGKE
jgi:hypothetical protein